MNFVSYTGLANCVTNWLKDLPEYDVIVGIERSGIIPATMIALYRNVPFITLSQFVNKQMILAQGMRGKNREIKKVLVVDDSMFRGNQLIKAKQMIDQARLSFDFQIEYGVVFVTPDYPPPFDIRFYSIIPQVRCFQWNVLHHTEIMKTTCMDMDGVLCENPSPEVNDDGEKYEQFLKTAKPLFVPTVEIGAIVTSRLEKYRALTEEWAFNHNVKYKQLIMMDLPDKESRIKYGHARYKSENFVRTGHALFIENEEQQAHDIHLLTGKPVLLVSDKKEWRMIQ